MRFLAIGAPKKYSLGVKRVPGALALLVILVAFAIPYIRAIMSALKISQLQPFALTVGQAVWLASLLGAILFFVMATIFPKTWRGGIVCVIAGMVLLGSGWSYQKAEHLESLNHLNDTNLDKDPDVPKMRAGIEKLIPLQTPLTDAKSHIESLGFACTVTDGIRNPPRSPLAETMSVKPSMHLYCWKEDRWPNHANVVRRWEVEFSFPSIRDPNPGVWAMQVRCGHYFWRIFLFSAIA